MADDASELASASAETAETEPDAESEPALCRGGIREEASGPGWQEHFVDGPRASASSSVGQSVAQSFSYVSILHFASDEERRVLLDSAADVKGSTDSTDAGSSHILFASGANHNCDRYSVKTILNSGARAASAALLSRLLGFLDGSSTSSGDDPRFLPDGGGARMAALADEVFGHGCDAAASNADSGLNLRERKVVWYDEPDEAGRLHPEPKVNVYTEGGYFSQHGDGMDLTLLVVLNDSEQFEGGGTAFYRDLDLSHDDLDIDVVGSGLEDMCNTAHSLKPESVARPQAGTALIWGGTLQHMALPVTRGTRAVYVGSFDLK